MPFIVGQREPKVWHVVPERRPVDDEVFASLEEGTNLFLPLGKGATSKRERINTN